MILPATFALLSLVTPAERFDEWPTTRFVTTPAACFRHADLVARLRALESRYPGRARVEEVSRSAEGRPIHLLTVGQGPTSVLLWSQMHGDEPSATPALLDLADRLLAEEGTPRDGHVLDRLTLLLVPMLNPDGAERYARRNSQGIDINRDAQGHRGLRGWAGNSTRAAGSLDSLP